MQKKEQIEKVLIEKAFEMREFSYTPYSGFNVGAALLAKNGNIYGGCNIENASYTPTVCAERTAFFKAISEGVKEFDMICIVGGPKDATEFDLCPPCGVCRQVMAEFCDPDEFKIILARSVEDYQVISLRDMLPYSFTPKNLNK